MIFEGENLEVDPPRRLVKSLATLWGKDMKSEGPSQVTWEIQPVGIPGCSTSDELREGAYDQLFGGGPMVLSGLKTLLETGEILTTPGSLRWLQNRRRAIIRSREV